MEKMMMPPQQMVVMIKQRRTDSIWYCAEIIMVM
jgi:hypothetical protein